MRDQVILRVQVPGGPGVRVHVARLIDPKTRKTVIDLTALDDYTVQFELEAVTVGTYQLAVEITGYPTLRFSIVIADVGGRTFDFVAPAPACATISVQQASAGVSVSRRIHMVHLALPPKHEAVVLVAGVDLKGGTRYVEFAETWRDDLYSGRTDLGDDLDQPIARAIHDHTVISIFDFRTGYLAQQIKGVEGWHIMHRALQGAVKPDIKRPKDDDALERRQKADSISILDVYRHMSELGRVSRGCVRQLHFFGHAYLRGPVLQNTSDANGHTDLRDPTDKDPRTKDFLPVNLAQYKYLPDAFDSQTHVKNWGCFGSDMKDELVAVARTKTLDQVVMVNGEPYSSADAIRELRMFTFPESYMVAFCRELGVDGWSLPPGTTSIYKTSSKYHYFHLHKSKHGGVPAWYKRYFGCVQDLGGAVSYRNFL
jgi:hypothetical protein